MYSSLILTRLHNRNLRILTAISTDWNQSGISNVFFHFSKYIDVAHCCLLNKLKYPIHAPSSQELSREQMDEAAPSVNLETIPHKIKTESQLFPKGNLYMVQCICVSRLEGSD
ncbi:hypothetical protein Y1Q_0010667 [Alligator mississippiensis]|uniref:Uncharacterized protein n=1 Tax=Alligator mississippiensis TaxID=8496 RepID=A0A151M6I6_ALLMI|nr:hypothetical protein Y1Q_0010667 [Alligator mississippiensis]